MLDIKFVRDNPDAVKENIKKKFQDAKLPLVDEVIEKDAKYRECLKEVETLKAARNKLSKANGPLFGQLKKCGDEAKKAELQAQIDANNAAVKADADKMAELEAEEAKLAERIQEIMYTIPQMIDPSVPIGPDDTYNVEAQRFGEPVVPDFPIPYHTEIMESFDGIDMDAAGRVAGNGFYYLLGNIARLHEAVLAYARDFMIDKGFTYVIPPFMMHGNVVQGVMSFPEMDAMMYKIEGEDLYLIGTSEHTMIGRFIDQTLDEAALPLTLTSYSPCFRKEKGAHGIEERGIYRIHQFEKQEMIVVCRPEESADWYEKLWKNSVELFRSMEIPVRQLECCSGDLADLKVKSCDIEAWSPRQQKYFEVCSCSNLGDAQARRLHIRFKDENGKTQLRIAETEKYAHVTFFFNGGVEAPYEGEDRCVIPSPKVATYDLKPEMSAPEVADECVKRIESGKYDVVILNFANCDMVGHTGVFEAAVKAVEAVDAAVEKVVTAVLNAGGCAFLTADHGNAEKMKNPDGTPFTAHTTNVVPFVAIGCGDVKLREGGCLADIAPTMLPYIGLPVPAEMTGKSIIAE